MVFGRSSITLHAALMICAVSLLVTSAWAAPQEKVLNSFNGATGTYPEAGLIFDQAGNLYGTTFAGGDLNACGGAGCGTVFELSPQGRRLDGRGAAQLQLQTARMESIPTAAWSSTPPAIFTAQRNMAAPMATARCSS